MTPYAATSLESPESLGTENSGSSSSQSRTGRTRTGRKSGSQRNTGSTESSNSQSAELNSDGGEGAHTPLVPSPARDLKVGDRVRILEAAQHVQHLVGQVGVVCRVRATIVNVETESGEKQYFYREWLERLESSEEPEAVEVAIESSELKVGDRVRVKRGYSQGLVSVVTKIDPTLAHSIALEPGKGRFKPDMLEKLVSKAELAEQAEAEIAVPELKVGDRVRILKAKRYQGFFAKVREIDGATASVMPDSPDAKFLMPVAIADLEKCPSVDEVYSAPAHELEEEDQEEGAIAVPELKVGDRVQFSLYCFGESRVGVAEIKEKVGEGYSYLNAHYEVKLPPVEEIHEQYREIYPADGFYRGITVANKRFLEGCTPIHEIPTPESILTKHGLIDSSEFADPRDIGEVYRDWGIALATPNGGIIALDIFRGDQSWGKPTEDEFDYSDQDGIVNHAKSVIDEIEAAIAANQPPQLCIPGVEEVQEEGAISVTSPDALDELIRDLKEELEPAIAPTSAVVMMSAAEARSCVDGIKGHIESARKLLLDLYEREGWKALGFNSWRECAVAEFGESKSQLYRELEAAKIERNISPIGEIGSIKESHLRPLAKLEPEQQREVWEEAVSTAPNGKVTAAHVQEVAEKRLPPVQEEIPSLEELFKLYGQIAERVEHRPTHKYRNQFAVERTAHPAFSFYPLGRREAWQAWERKYRKYLERCPLPPEKQMLHPGYPLSEPKPVEVFPVQQSCKSCQHRHLVGDGSEFTCGTKGDKWLCAATRDWADENGGCDKFKPFGQSQVVTVEPPAGDKTEEVEVSVEPEQRHPIYAFDLTTSQYNKLAIHAKAAGMSMVGYLQKLVEELPEA